MGTFEWIILGVIFIMFLIILILWILRHLMELCFLDADIDLATVEGYTGGWTPWETFSDILALHKTKFTHSTGTQSGTGTHCCGHSSPTVIDDGTSDFTSDFGDVIVS